MIDAHLQTAAALNVQVDKVFLPVGSLQGLKNELIEPGCGNCLEGQGGLAWLFQRASFGCGRTRPEGQRQAAIPGLAGLQVNQHALQTVVASDKGLPDVSTGRQGQETGALFLLMADPGRAAAHQGEDQQAAGKDKLQLSPSRDHWHARPRRGAPPAALRTPSCASGTGLLPGCAG